MYFRISSIIFLLSLPVYLFCQTDETLFTINSKKISKTEFVESFSKNNPINIVENRDSARHYLNQYIEFKLKVFDAENKGFDKKQEFKDEFEKYRKQLAQPYLIDQEMVQNLAKEAYERMKTEVRARHIQVRIAPNASPKDSLIAYQKTLKILKRLSSGEDFETLAKQVSDDPQAVNNGGDLWYIGPFSVPYNLENYLYTANPGKYSNPIRTYLGYHIVQIIDKRSNPGRYKVAHIMISLPNDTAKKSEIAAKQLADSIYQLVIEGQDFAKLAIKYSNDNGTSANGGELPWFESGKMPHEFELASFNLKEDGAISKPVKTRFGWHIIKRIAQKGIPDYKQIEEQLIQRVSSGERGEIAVQKVIDHLKNEYHFTDFSSLSTVINLIDSTIFMAEWKVPEDIDLSGNLFSFDNQTYTQKDFAKYLECNQKKMFPIPIENYISQQYDEFIKQTMLSYEETMLEKKNIPYRLLVNEFHDGILYFDIMQKEVWDKAALDKTGLDDYYSKNENLYNNFYQADVSIFEYGINDSTKIEKLFRKLKNSNLDDNEIAIKIQSTLDENFKFVKRLNDIEGKEPIIDKCLVLYKTGKLEKDERLIMFNSDKELIWLNNEIQKTEKPIEDINGIVLADYQKYLEKIWVSNLKKKYDVEINEKVFESIFNNK